MHIQAIEQKGLEIDAYPNQRKQFVSQSYKFYVEATHEELVT